MNIRSARKLFARAPVTHRPMARWIWNDHLEPDRLVRQLDRLMDQGLGGALIRPGAGLPDGTYLSDAWFEAMSVVVRRARKRHASIWIAEDLDDPWTQEIVRGITSDRPELATKMLRMRRTSDGRSGISDTDSSTDHNGSDQHSSKRIVASDYAAAFEIVGFSSIQARRGAPQPLAVRSIDRRAVTSEENAGSHLLFQEETCSGRLSLLGADGAVALLGRTHQLYREHLKRYFGNTLGMCMLLGSALPASDHAVPWDDDLPHLFEETHNYSLLDNLPLLYFDLPGFERVRYDFWSIVGEMFDEGVATAFERWCDEQGIPGGVGMNSLRGSAERVACGGSRMWHAAGFSYTVLSSRMREPEHAKSDRAFARDLIEAREAVSLRRQLDKAGPIVDNLSLNTKAAFTSGPNPTATALGMGIEFHAGPVVLSSLRGARKSNGPWRVSVDNWNQQRVRPTTDAQARASWISDSASGSAEVLLIDPIQSLMALFRPTSENPSTTHDALARHYESIAQALADAHIDFDLGDEQVLARHGSTDQRELRVGSARYGIVVLPPLVNLRASTLALLHDFAMSGGQLFAAGTIPEMIDGRPSDEAKTFFQEYGHRIVQGIDFGDYRELIDRLVQLGARTVAAFGKGGESRPGVCLRRGRWDALDVITVVNSGPSDEAVSVEWVPDATGTVEQWDPATGRMDPVAPCEEGATARVPLNLPPGSVRLLVAAPGDAKSAKIDARPRVEQGRLKPAWQGRRLQPNACALTQCRVSNQDDWGSIDNARELIASRIEASGGPVTLPVEWRFDVKAGVEATDGWSVAIELSEDASLSLNGASIALDEREVLFDPAISSVSLPAVSAGEHLLGLTRTFAEPGDLQPPWVLGPFRVEQTDAGGRTLVVDDGSVTLGRWSEAGLPSYFGEVVYRAEVEGAPLEDGARVMLEMDWLGNVGEVRVNGKLVDAVFAAPYECDLTAQWGPGTRAVEITLTAAPDDALAGLRGLGDADVTNAGLKAPEIAIYGRGGREQ